MSVLQLPEITVNNCSWHKRKQIMQKVQKRLLKKKTQIQYFT